MPIYVVHGFRWPRPAIRIHVILNNLDDVAPDYICGPDTSASLIENLCDHYPKTMAALPNLRFVEQYDPTDLSDGSHCQPYAFVADKVEVCKLSVDIGEVMGQGIATDGWGALVELRDKLAPNEKVGWWVVYNGDEPRSHSIENGDGSSKEDVAQKKSKGKFKKFLNKG